MSLNCPKLVEIAWQFSLIINKMTYNNIITINKDIKWKNNGSYYKFNFKYISFVFKYLNLYILSFIKFSFKLIHP